MLRKGFQFAHRTIFKNQSFRFSEAKKQTEINFTFQELLEKNTPQSLGLAAKLMVQLEKEEKKQGLIKKQLQQKIGRFSKGQEESLKKLDALKKNLLDQHEQVKLIKTRAQRQIQQAKQFSIVKFAKEIIQVSDNLRRCSQMTTKHYAQNHDKFALALLQSNQSLVSVLQKFGIKEFNPTGEIYDPNTQQSMVQVPDPSKPNNTVAMTTVTGYTIQGRLLRSAKVCVYRS